MSGGVIPKGVRYKLVVENERKLGFIPGLSAF